MKTIIESLTSQVDVLSKQMNKPEGKPKIPQEIIDKLRMAEQKLKKAEERKQKYKGKLKKLERKTSPKKSKKTKKIRNVHKYQTK